MKKYLVTISFLSFFCLLVGLGWSVNARTRNRQNKPVIKQEEQQAESIESESWKKEDFDVEAKRKEVIDLVEAGIAYFKEHELENVLNTFTHEKDFVKGELYLFLYDIKGNCLAHGQQAELLWQDLFNLQDNYGAYVIQEIINKAKAGGGWITYKWRGATKVSYVKEVSKLGKQYVIGSGYYPHSKEDAVVNLVKGAVALFNNTIKEGRSKEDAFSTFSYPGGRFVLGDLYLYAISFDGVHVAHGDRSGLIGISGWNYRDATGKYVNQEIINKLKETSHGIWVEYISRRASKRTYAEKITDAKGNHYFIACGYYPEANRDSAVELVRNGYRFMKAHGLSQSVDDFNDRKNDTFRYGDLDLFVYDLEGTCRADGNNLDFVGRNQLDNQDEDGRYMVKEIIQKAKNGGGWIDFKLQNSFQSIYVELINLGIEQYVIGCGLYPISKHETMVLLAKSAAGYLRTEKRADALRKFVGKKSNFLRGDLGVFVYDFNGICLANKDDYDVIWKNFMGVTDDNGKPYVKLFINTVRRGPGRVTYKLHGSTIVAFVEKVEKEGHSYVVGSSYYL